MAEHPYPGRNFRGLTLFSAVSDVLWCSLHGTLCEPPIRMSAGISVQEMHLTSDADENSVSPRKLRHGPLTEVAHGVSIGRPPRANLKQRWTADLLPRNPNGIPRMISIGCPPRLQTALVRGTSATDSWRNSSDDFYWISIVYISLPLQTVPRNYIYTGNK